MASQTYPFCSADRGIYQQPEIAFLIFSVGKTVYIVGFMGAGKSTLGRKLANAFDADFIDLDKYIELKEGKKIHEIFEEKGENYFRKSEAESLREIKSDKNLFVATGGGTPCHSENMRWMKENGVVIYLNIPPQILIGRLKNNDGTRPLIKSLTEEQLAEFVIDKLSERSDFYEMADIIVSHNKNLSLLKTELKFLFM
jgi:shikimate kinase